MPYPRITISQRSMTGRAPEVLVRFLACVGVGTIVGPYDPKRGNPYYTYRAYGWEKTLHVAKMLWPYLGEVKKAQALRCLRAYKEARR